MAGLIFFVVIMSIMAAFILINDRRKEEQFIYALCVAWLVIVAGVAVFAMARYAF